MNNYKSFEAAMAAMERDPTVFESLPDAFKVGAVCWRAMACGQSLNLVPMEQRTPAVCLKAVQARPENWDVVPEGQKLNPAMREAYRESLEREMRLNPFARFGETGARFRALDEQDRAMGIERPEKPGILHRIGLAIPAFVLGCAAWQAEKQKRQHLRDEEAPLLPSGARNKLL